MFVHVWVACFRKRMTQCVKHLTGHHPQARHSMTITIAAAEMIIQLIKSWRALQSNVVLSTDDQA